VARRTKEELIASNYYSWLEVCDALRKKKKDGGKLSLKEKETLRTIPSPESPYSGEDAVSGQAATSGQAAKKRRS